MGAKPWSSAKRPWTKCLGCTKDHSWISIFVKSFQTPKLPNTKKSVDILWISPGAGRPVRSWGIEAPRNSSKTPVNSQKSSLTQRPGSPAALVCPAGPAVKLRNSRKKTKVSAIFVPEAWLRRHRARPLILNSTFGIKSQFSAKKILRSILTGQEAKVYIPGRDISEMPEEYRKDGNA